MEASRLALPVQQQGSSFGTVSAFSLYIDAEVGGSSRLKTKTITIWISKIKGGELVVLYFQQFVNKYQKRFPKVHTYFIMLWLANIRFHHPVDFVAGQLQSER